CCGDFFIWASPNAGNPQKVQRYPKEWAVALRQMAGLGAEALLPGHGLPVIGADRVTQALTDAAELLEFLHDQTVAMMNEGARLRDRGSSGAGRQGRPHRQGRGLRAAGRVRAVDHVEGDLQVGGPRVKSHRRLNHLLTRSTARWSGLRVPIPRR